MKILITGSSGYIGSHLSKLLEKDFEVHGLDIRDPQHQVKKFYKLDINELEYDQTEFYDTVIHLAALANVSESERIPVEYYNTNLFGTVNVVNKIPCNNFIFASTGAAELCQSAYGISKRAAEDVVKNLCTNKKIPYTIFRFYNVIGTLGYPPTNKDGLMYNLVNSADTGTFTIYGNDYDTHDGTCIRDYVHVDEICHSIKSAILSPSCAIEGLGHGEGYSVLEMFNMFKMINNLKIDLKYGPRRPGDATSNVLGNVSKYMKELYQFEDLLKLK